MADRVSPSGFQSAIETLHGYLGDLVGASNENVTDVARAFEQHSTKLRLFVNFCQKDDVIRFLAERLHRRFTIDAVAERAMAETLVVPPTTLDRAAFFYHLLVLLKQKHRVDVRELLSRVAKGSSIEDRWRDFRRTWVTRFAESVRKITDVALNLVKDAEYVEPDDAFGRAFAELEAEAPPAPPPAAPAPAPARPTITAAPAAATSAAPTPVAPGGRTVQVPVAPSLGGAVTWSLLLRAATSLAPEETRGDLAVDAELLELELKKSRPNTARIEELVRGFEAVGDAWGVLARQAAARVLEEAPAAKPKGAAKKTARAGKKKASE